MAPPDGSAGDGPIAAEAIDAHFVAVPRREVVFLELDGELVITTPGIDDEQRFDSHWLDGTATVVWNCFDGVAPLDELAEDLSEAFDAPYDVVLEDVLTLTRTLGAAGLLEGVSPAAPLVAPTGDGLPVGTQLSVGTLHRFDGTEVLTDTLGSGGAVYVNWSPGCGHCVRIAPDLAALVADARGSGCEVVLVAAGTAEDNQRVAEESGLDATIVRNEGFGPFAGRGTPVAYRVDSAGVTVDGLAAGAPQVVALVRAAAGSTSVPEDPS